DRVLLSVASGLEHEGAALHEHAAHVDRNRELATRVVAQVEDDALGVLHLAHGARGVVGDGGDELLNANVRDVTAFETGLGERRGEASADDAERDRRAATIEFDRDRRALRPAYAVRDLARRELAHVLAVDL